MVLRSLTARLVRFGPATCLAAAFLVGLAVVALVGPVLTSRTPADLDASQGFIPPVWSGGTSAHLLGTDHLGRDVAVLTVYGARLSLLIATVTTVVGAVTGTVLGLVAGYKGGLIDTVISRLADAQLSLPFIVLALAVVVSMGPSIGAIVFVVAASIWVPYARVVRAEVLQLKSAEFVDLARVADLPLRRILWRHILPNVMPSVLVLATLDFGKVIVFEASLSFLGLGIQPPSTSWGLQIAEGRSYLTEVAPWLVLVPATILALTALSANLLGDAARDRFDPQLQVAS